MSNAENCALLGYDAARGGNFLRRFRGNFSVSSSWFVIIAIQNHKVGALLQDAACSRLAKDPTEKVERKTSLLLKTSTLAEEVCKPWRPAGTRPPRLCGLPKIHKEGFPLRPIVSNIGAPTYDLSKYLAGLLSPQVGRSSHHVSLFTLWVALEGLVDT
jgi:hypothetical protein